VFRCPAAVVPGGTICGVWVLPGSDPLPFRSQETRAGRYGFVLPERLDLNRPAAQIRRFLLECSEQPAIFGRREGLMDSAAVRSRCNGGNAERPPPMKALVIAPQPFFSPRGTPFSVYYRTQVMSELGVKIDLLTYGLGQDVDIPNVRIIRIPHLRWLGPVKVGRRISRSFWTAC